MSRLARLVRRGGLSRGRTYRNQTKTRKNLTEHGPRYNLRSHSLVRFLHSTPILQSPLIIRITVYLDMSDYAESVQPRAAESALQHRRCAFCTDEAANTRTLLNCCVCSRTACKTCVTELFITMEAPGPFYPVSTPQCPVCKEYDAYVHQVLPQKVHGEAAEYFVDAIGEVAHRVRDALDALNVTEDDDDAGEAEHRAKYFPDWPVDCLTPSAKQVIYIGLRDSVLSIPTEKSAAERFDLKRIAFTPSNMAREECNTRDLLASVTNLNAQLPPEERLKITGRAAYARSDDGSVDPGEIPKRPYIKCPGYYWGNGYSDALPSTTPLR